ncbi:MAG TPA: hypothetical protein VFA43_04170 [Gemmatimonadaceae bacterium]|nr:hypothetical protein [Gemmatimonadaceae bacterium]
MRAVAAALLLAGSAAGQPATPGLIIDQGSFTITVTGSAPVSGRETFAIRRAPGGFQASGTVLFADRRLSPTLSTDPTGFPLSYALDVRSGPGRLERVSVARDRAFLTLRARVSEQESVRELPATIARRAPDSALVGGTVIVDDDIVHQYYFLILGRREGTVSVVVPARRRVISMRVERLGPDSVRVGGKELAAVRVRVTSDSDDERLVWIDGAGRILQLARPEKHLMAVRDSPPQP